MSRCGIVRVELSEERKIELYRCDSYIIAVHGTEIRFFWKRSYYFLSSFFGEIFHIVVLKGYEEFWDEKERKIKQKTRREREREPEIMNGCLLSPLINNTMRTMTCTALSLSLSLSLSRFS